MLILALFVFIGVCTTWQYLYQGFNRFFGAEGQLNRAKAEAAELWRKMAADIETARQRIKED